MPWEIVQNDDGCPDSKPWGVRKQTDNSLEGCHATKADAEDHMKALYANEEDAAMQYSIKRTDTGWQILAADGTEVASFTGTEESAYQDAVAHMGALVTRALAAEDGQPDMAVPVPTGEGLLPERWEDVDGIAFQQALPGGRDFTECAWSWRDPESSVLPLMLQTANEGGHWGAELAGFIDAISLDGGTVHAGGRFYDNTAGNEARVLLLDGRKFGVSVDPSEAVSVEIECGEMDEFGWCMDETMKFVAYEIAGLTMVPFPGFEDAAIKLAASNRIMFIHNEAAIRLAVDDTEDQTDDGADEEEEKSTHAEVNYADQGAEGKQCQDCAHYVNGSPPSCQIVVDPISATATCDSFVALQEPANEGDASIIAASISIPDAPPRAWFEVPEPQPGQPFGADMVGDDVLVEQRRPRYDARSRVIGFDDEVLGLACPFTITDDGQVYGHLTYWGQCHIGNPWGPGKCAAPSPSMSNYDDFYGSGYVVCDDGSELRCGLLHVGCEHSTAMDVRGVRDAAAHAGLAFAQVRVVDGEFGPWMCGALLPTTTPEQVVKLRALTLSGEWAPELGAVIAVNDGGLPLQRVDRIAASSGAVFPVADRVMRASLAGGDQTKLVGGNAIYRCPECQKRAAAARAHPERQLSDALRGFEAQLDTIIQTLDQVESRTRHLIGPEAEAIRAALEHREKERRQHGR